MSAYKRLINEYSRYFDKLEKPKEFQYKIYTIDEVDYSKDFSFKTIVLLNYQGQSHEVHIFYAHSYPFTCPSKLSINGNNLFDFYRSIQNSNKLLFRSECLCCKSLLCMNNWACNKTIEDIIKEVKMVITYKDLYIQRLLLNKIINKYTNQNMDYLHHYLL